MLWAANRCTAHTQLTSPPLAPSRTFSRGFRCHRCLNYGGLFIGANAAEVLGDYGAGPNHVLPTGGTGKYTGGLSIFNFIRVRTWMRIDDAAASQQVRSSLAFVAASSSVQLLCVCYTLSSLYARARGRASTTPPRPSTSAPLLRSAFLGRSRQ
jgi:Histidinol dehydrogenase